LDKTSVYVGTTVVDERLYQNITLHNNGGLGTNYRLVKTNLLRNEKNKTQINDDKKEDIQIEVPTSSVGSSSLEKETSTVSGLIRI
jgi:hypothetical protein